MRGLMWKQLSRAVLLFGFLMSFSLALGQREGLIVEGNVRGEQAVGSLNPLRCDNPYCRRITDFLFPSLLHVDPDSGTTAPATETDGLADSWTINGDTITYTLRSDR